VITSLEEGVPRGFFLIHLDETLGPKLTPHPLGNMGLLDAVVNGGRLCLWWEGELN
jgi:hypothetical protein